MMSCPALRLLRRSAVIIGLVASVTLPSPRASAQNGQSRHDEVLLGFHFGDLSNNEGQRHDDYPLQIWPFFEDYLQYMPDELKLTSYADFWRWWYVLERYKGDEKGLEELDQIVNDCLQRGIKVKIDLAWSTWWTQDKDWEKVAPAGTKMPVGPQDLDDWVHLCDLLGRHYRGRIAVWDLQCEANDLEHYWQSRPIEFVQQVYRFGYRAFKRADPGCLIGVSDASPSVSAQALDAWYWSNLSNCKGYYDNVPINYFADIADPYKGAINYYNSIRGMLDQLGERNVEVGMGETSVQWAESTQTAATGSLNIEKQAVSTNKVFGQLFDAGMNKFILWATEFAPGGGHWPWRWGLRNYEDWWGAWPDSFKVPGTQIVYRYKAPDGKEIDLRPQWPRPADPFYPAWEVFRFWSQVAPAGSESVRVPITTSCPTGIFWKLAAFQQSANRAIVLLYNEQCESVHVSVDLSEAGWPSQAPLTLEAQNETVDFGSGVHTPTWNSKWNGKLDKAQANFDLPALTGFTSISIRNADTVLDAACEGRVISETFHADESVEGYVVLRNTGTALWLPRRIRLAQYEDPLSRPDKQEPVKEFSLASKVKPGETVAIKVVFPAESAAGYVYRKLRLRDSARVSARAQGWFGPVFGVAYRVKETGTPRNLVANREVGHVRLKWFPPLETETASYEVQRAPGFDQPFNTIAKTDLAEYIDQPPEQDKAYYYRVLARDAQGRCGRPSNEDNAKASSQPRILDAEVIAHTVPPSVRIGDTAAATITIRNTGSKTWDLTRPTEVRYCLQPTQLWGRRNETQLPRVEIEEMAQVAPGGTVTFKFPFVGPKEGLYRNHWIMYMEVPGTRKEAKSGWEGTIQYAYFGTPLIVETTVKAK